MLNFAVGPVMSSEEVLKIGGEQVPYFRTGEFSKIMLESQDLFLKFLHAPKGSRMVFMTGSGTASMEAVVASGLTNKDKVLIVNGGSFGHRFVEIVDFYNLDYSSIDLEFGKALTKEDLAKFDGKGYTAFLVNLDETSTGVFYDIELISEFCKRNKMLLIVDAISCFLTDPINMEKYGINFVITGSQKALGCQPGISLIAMDKVALQRVDENPAKLYYLDVKRALKDMERGQTPFTPAVGIIRQIHARLLQIERDGGIETEIERSRQLAKYFRDNIKDLPFEITSNSLCNAVTPIHPLNVDAYSVFEVLKDEYGIWICPNGGELKNKIFRVGHMGCLTKESYDTLIKAFKDLQKRGLL
jgi:aspartate aminotransferase-like enzyme